MTTSSREDALLDAIAREEARLAGLEQAKGQAQARLETLKAELVALGSQPGPGARLPLLPNISSPNGCSAMLTARDMPRTSTHRIPYGLRESLRKLPQRTRLLTEPLKEPLMGPPLKEPLMERLIEPLLLGASQETERALSGPSTKWRRRRHSGG